MFGKDFKWGAATASYQIEGAYDEDGKGLSVWDVFSAQAGRILGGENGNTACDHYHRYKEDVKIMQQLGLKAYRFSVSWPRILPEGTGRVNEKGLDFYDRLTDELLSAGIEPFLTLYHWDMPYELNKKGGFRNSDLPVRFAEYAAVVAKRLGDRCKNFITLNEPQCFVNLGYRVGIHAPGYRLSDEEIAEILPVVLRCHGRAAEAVRANVKEARVSFAACGEYYYPSEENEELIAKTAEYNFNQSSPYGCSWFLDPIFLGKFPEKFEQDFPKVAGSFTPSDFKSVRNSVDYLGFNFYTAAKTALDERGNLKIAENEAGCPVTAMDWPVRENSFYWMLKFLYAWYGAPLMIFENGAACNDWVALDGKVHDEARIDYLKRHINAMERAKNEGVDIRGYFVWSLLDNFEWSFGFKPRFGLVYVDYETQKRTIKESGYWYSEFIRNVR